MARSQWAGAYEGPLWAGRPPIAVRGPPPPIAIRAPSLRPLWEAALWAMLLWAMAAVGYRCCRLYLPCRLCLL